MAGALTGPGGVGKSRLMVEAARRLGPGFADGARFLELASVSAADLVAAAIAAGLGLNTSAGPLITDLESYLRPGGCCWRWTISSRLWAPLRCWLSCLPLLRPGSAGHQPDGAAAQRRARVPRSPAAGSARRGRPRPRGPAAVRLGEPVRGAGARRCPGLRADRRKRRGGGGDLRGWTGCRWPSSWPRPGSGCCPAGAGLAAGHGGSAC